jgi:predicted TPR repeat methyltransferase
MSGSAFGRAYAEIYDWLYSDKDYAGECDLLEELFRRCSGREIQSILDLGCGTGGHAFPLADRGYQVLGVDRSADMIAQASRSERRWTRQPASLANFCRATCESGSRPPVRRC